MLGYRRKSFGIAHGLLEELRANQDRLEPLIALQKLLLSEIEVAEGRIRDLKHELNLLDKADGPASEKRERFLRKRIEGLRQLNYIWRSFGDAIAFLYLSKFSLKQTHYNTKNVNPKQDAGFLAGKAGMAAEIAFVEQAIHDGIPALLVDITNTIRHGDVCLMAGPDPHLIEVKAGSKLGSRGKKQIASIRKLHDFLEKDHASELRGFKDVRRIAHQTPERSYEYALNACIEKAVTDGYAIEEPERGLCYVVISDQRTNISDVFAKVSFGRPWVFALNVHKANRDWAPYVPFTLTIKSSLRLYEFLRGSIYILVIVDLNSLCEMVAERGFTAELDFENEDFPLKITFQQDAALMVSSHFMRRVGLEFVSLSWIIDSAIESFERNKQNWADAGTIPS